MIPYDALENTFRTDFFPESPNCRSTDPDLFFPESMREKKQIALAKSFCAFCVEKVACRTYALKADERDGIWGGLDEEERRVIRSNDKEKVRSAHQDGKSIKEIALITHLEVNYVEALVKEITRPVALHWGKNANLNEVG